MEPPTEPSRRARRAWAVAATATTAAVLACYAAFTLDRPYHVDTVLYLRDVRALLESGASPSAFPTRPGNAWAYLPGFALLGEAGLRWTNLAAATATIALLLVAVRRDFGRTVAWASAVTLAATPAFVLNVTHLKEDANALALVAGALALSRPGAGMGRAAAAGALAGLAVPCKEWALFFVPFLALHVHLSASRASTWRDLVRRESLRAGAPADLAFLGAAAAALLVVAPGHFRAMLALTDSPYQAQFAGLGALASPQVRDAWRDGAGHAAALPAFALVAAAAALARGELRLVLWAASGAVVLAALGTTTVTRGRVFAPAFFLLLPPAWAGVRLAVAAAARLALPAAAARVSAAAAAALALGLAAWQAADMIPTLAYRRAYPPQAAFFEGVGGALPDGALLYGADSCPLAGWYTGRECRQAPVDAGPSAAAAFVAGLADEARRRPVLLLPDFASYDGFGAVASALAAGARVEVAHSGMGEDYHEMAWAPSVEEDAANVERRLPGCRRVRVEAVPLDGAPAPGFSWASAVFRCGEQERVRAYVSYRGHVTSLVRLDVLRVLPR